MNKFYITHFLILIVLIGFLSCTHECPEPISKAISNHKITLRDSQIKDTYVTSHFPTSNSSNDTGMEVVAWTYLGTPFVRRSYIKFDYSSIPSGVTIQKATITLYADTVKWTKGHSKMSGENDWYFRKVTSAWDPATIIWNNRPSDNPVAQLVLPASTSSDQTYTMDITSLVADEIAAPSTAHGFVMQLVNESYYRAITFATSENSNPAIRPTLAIEYTQ